VTGAAALQASGLLRAFMGTHGTQHSYGVFKPIGHVVASFPDAEHADHAEHALRRAGIDDEGALRRIGPEEMKARAEADIARASPLASIGQDLNLVKAHRDLAHRGYEFLVVKAEDSAHAAQIAEIARTHGAERAQYFGAFIVEELIEHPGDAAQVAESPDRGLDAQKPSGNESERATLRRGSHGPGA
jgi:hypothetical protein